MNYTINTELINIKSTLFEERVSWKAIIKVQEVTDWFLLKPNALTFYALPKNQLNPSQQTWLREKITTK
ncbi:MAG: YcxB family protein [Arcicella sp.]|jgi:hypothetical protein|nr:YcxB family protein [Arcicella sp.]